MSIVKRKNFFAYLALAALLALIVVGIVLTFAQGIDKRQFFVQIDPRWCVLPFMLSFPVYITLEFIASKANQEGTQCLLTFPSKQHAKVVEWSFYLAMLALVGGVILLIVGIEGLASTWMCFLESFITFLPLAVYLAFSIAFHVKEKSSVKVIAALIADFVLLLAIEIAVLMLSTEIGTGFLLGYVALPTLCLTMAFVHREDEPSSQQ